MVDVKAEAEFPNFSMKIYTHEFILENVDEVLDYCLNLKVENDDWDKYNLFNSNDKPIKDMALQIHKEISCFNKNNEIRNDLWINGWFNIIKYGESIAPHFHSAEKESYYSCNISLQNYSTKTLFYPPWGDRHGHIIAIDNSKGKGMFFPQWLWHEVPTSNEKIRYTLGIDIHTDAMMEKHDPNAPIAYSRKLTEFY